MQAKALIEDAYGTTTSVDVSVAFNDTLPEKYRGALPTVKSIGVSIDSDVVAVFLETSKDIYELWSK